MKTLPKRNYGVITGRALYDGRLNFAMSLYFDQAMLCDPHSLS